METCQYMDKVIQPYQKSQTVCLILAKLSLVFVFGQNNDLDILSTVVENGTMEEDDATVTNKD